MKKPGGFLTGSNHDATGSGGLNPGVLSLETSFARDFFGAG